MRADEKVFGENHGKDLWKLTLEEMKLLSDARKAETARRHKMSAKIKANNLRSKQK
jgi:hypothetical protein